MHSIPYSIRKSSQCRMPSDHLTRFDITVMPTLREVLMRRSPHKDVVIFKTPISVKTVEKYRTVYYFHILNTILNNLQSNQPSSSFQIKLKQSAANKQIQILKLNIVSQSNWESWKAYIQKWSCEMKIKDSLMKEIKIRRNAWCSFSRLYDCDVAFRDTETTHKQNTR